MSDRACGTSGGSLARAMQKISYDGYRFPPVICQQANWLYLRFTLSLRDVEDLLAERGIAVSYETGRRWANHFGPWMPQTSQTAPEASHDVASHYSNRSIVGALNCVGGSSRDAREVMLLDGVALLPLQDYAKIIEIEGIALHYGYKEMHATTPALAR